MITTAFLCAILLPTLLAINYDVWMSQLPEAKRTQSLLSIGIPGSHDSFTASLNASGPVADDEYYRKLLQILEDIVPRDVVNDIIYNWSVTQHFNVTQQLSAGIRYFDFRLCHYYPNKTTPYDVRICHGLYGDSVWSIIASMQSWLSHRPSEIVILDWDHFYNYTTDLHTYSQQVLESTFGPMLCPRLNDWTQLSVSWAQNQRCQVIVCYHDPMYSQTSWAYPEDLIVSPWANTDNLNTLNTFLSQNLVQRSMSSMYVVQGIRTEDAKDVAVHLRQTLFSLLAYNTTIYMNSWLATNQPAYQSLMNIVIVDFVDIPGYIDAVLNYNFNPTSSVMSDRLRTNRSH